MKKFIPFIAICLFCCNIYAQVTEAYPTSQRYLFNPYNRDSVYIDSASHWDDIYGHNIYYGIFGDGNGNDLIISKKAGEYQMYPVSNTSPVQV